MDICNLLLLKKELDDIQMQEKMEDSVSVVQKEIQQN